MFQTSKFQKSQPKNGGKFATLAIKIWTADPQVFENSMLPTLPC
jgi:hypothetical protein